MPKGKPLSGKRKEGGGRKPLPSPRLRFVAYLTDAEREQVKAFIDNLRNAEKPTIAAPA